MVLIKYGREVEEEDIFIPNELSKKAILFQESDVGKLTICSNEQLRHFLAKAVLLYHLLRMKHKVVCEAEIAGIGKGDLFDLNTRIQYEVETEKSIANINKMKEKYRQTGIDLIIVQIKKMPNDIKGMETYIDQFTRPD